MDIHKIISHRFTLAHGTFDPILEIIKQKFDEPWSSWKKVQIEVHNLCFEEFKKEYSSRIYKNAMSKIRNGHDHATWILPSEPQPIVVDLYLHKLITKKMAIQLQRPPSAWEVVEKTRKLKSGEWVNDKTHELAINSIFTFININLKFIRY
ncbi:hypothetical protein CR513_08697, partial [Mucuna pruriens]